MSNLATALVECCFLVCFPQALGLNLACSENSEPFSPFANEITMIMFQRPCHGFLMNRKGLQFDKVLTGHICSQPPPPI